MQNFKELGLSSDLVANLEKIGFTNPTEIQRRAIPELLTGKRDILGLAQTGTGKTAAFSLPIIDQIDMNSRHVQALILAPTRELAQQITTEVKRFSGSRHLGVVSIYGGQSIFRQSDELRRGARIVVGTPGRVIDMLNRKKLVLDNLTHVVIDEADDMLSMGFIEDIKTILGFAPAEKRTLLFSATMPRDLGTIVNRYMQDKLEIDLRSKEKVTKSLVKQYYCEVFQADKFEALRRILDSTSLFYGIAFCRTRLEADEVHLGLVKQGYTSFVLHGDISQDQREKIVRRFREVDAGILVATDVASRGFDIQGLTHVVNYSIPGQVESYVHRVGRTGRAGEAGTAISLVTPGERMRMPMFGRAAKTDIEKMQPPAVEQIISIQKKKLLLQFEEALEVLAADSPEKDLNKHCFSLAKTMLAEVDPTIAMASLLKQFCGSQLGENSYRTIKTPQNRPPRSGSQRSGGRQRRSNSSFRQSQPRRGREKVRSYR